MVSKSPIPGAADALSRGLCRSFRPLKPEVVVTPIIRLLLLTSLLVLGLCYCCHVDPFHQQSPPPSSCSTLIIIIPVVVSTVASIVVHRWRPEVEDREVDRLNEEVEQQLLRRIVLVGVRREMIFLATVLPLLALIGLLTLAAVLMAGTYRTDKLIYY